jgi:glycosyltransferase involved in cell wall biosynthesis
MKIGFFTDTYFPQINGVTYTINIWKKELEKLGHEVYIYYPEDERYKPENREVPMPSLPFMFYKGYHLGLPSFRHVEKDFDIVHVHAVALMADLGLAVARKQEIPCVLTYHTPPDRYMYEILPVNNELIQEAIKVGYYKYERELLKRVQLVTSPSEEIITMLRERLGDKIKRSMYFSNGIDTEFFHHEDGEKFRKELNIPKGRVIGYTGRHSTGKHLEDLISYADRFDGTVLIGGDGPLSEKYKELAKGKKNIMFLGFFERGKLCSFYSLLDLFIMPSTVETEGLVVLEANACGTPAVGADAMALKSTIKEGVNGLHYRPGDVDDLARAIEKAYRERAKLSKGAKEFVKDRSAANTAKRLVKVYEETISEYKKSKEKPKGPNNFSIRRFIPVK